MKALYSYNESKDVAVKMEIVEDVFVDRKFSSENVVLNIIGGMVNDADLQHGQISAWFCPVKPGTRSGQYWAKDFEPLCCVYIDIEINHNKLIFALQFLKDRLSTFEEFRRSYSFQIPNDPSLFFVFDSSARLIKGAFFTDLGAKRFVIDIQ